MTTVMHACCMWLRRALRPMTPAGCSTGTGSKVFSTCGTHTVGTHSSSGMHSQRGILVVQQEQLWLHAGLDMAFPPRQQHRLEFKDFARLPDELKTRIIIMSAQGSSHYRAIRYPAICVCRAWRDALWTHPSKLRIQLPVDVDHQCMNVLVRGTLRTVRKRAHCKAELDHHSASQGNSHKVAVTFTAAELPSDPIKAAILQELHTARIGLVLHSMDAGVLYLISQLNITADFISSELHLPALPGLTHLSLETKGTTLTAAFFARLVVPQLQYLTVWDRDQRATTQLSLERIVPPGARRLRCVVAHSRGQMNVDPDHMPAMPELIELHTSCCMSLAQLVSLTAGPLSSLQALSVRGLAPPDGVEGMPAAAVGQRLGVLSRVCLTGINVSLSAVARLKSSYGVDVFLMPTSNCVMLFVGSAFDPLHVLDPRVDSQIAELRKVVLPTLMAGERFWDLDVFVCFPRHQVATMVQMLGPKGWLTNVRLQPRDEYDLCDNLRQLRLYTTSFIPDIEVVTSMPELVVAQLFAQCWPDFPRNEWDYYPAEQ